MARRPKFGTTARVGWGAKFPNPNYRPPKTKGEKDYIANHGEPFDNRKWITTGTHHSPLAARKYMEAHHRHVKPESVRIYGIRVSVRAFDDRTEAALVRTQQAKP